jgi:hypothetical protein
MAYCPVSAQSEQKPCHKSENGQKDGPMLVLDCMGVDLFQQDAQIDLPQPDASADIIHFVWADLTAEYNFQPADIRFIRGPPDRTGQRPDSPPLILTTQRFRL